MDKVRIGIVGTGYIGNVHGDTIVDDSGRVRYGTGEVRVDRVEVVDPSLGTTGVVATGGAVTFRLHIEGEGSVPHPVVNLEIWRTDGVHVTTVSSLRSFDIGELRGGSTIDLHVTALALLPATYELRVGIADESGQHVVDHLNDAGRFDVVSHLTGVADGLMWVPVTWSHTVP